MDNFLEKGSVTRAKDATLNDKGATTYAPNEPLTSLTLDNATVTSEMEQIDSTP